jgi:hypothetical protein
VAFLMNYDEWQLLIFDTGPLWELILYSAVHDLSFRSLEGELRHLKERIHHKRLTEFVELFPKRTTSPHVVTEIGAWIRRTSKPGQADIWRLVHNEFVSMRMDEKTIRFLEMRLDLAADKGITDASVIHLGLQLADQNPKVLTLDAALAIECRRSGVDAVQIYEIIA